MASSVHFRILCMASPQRLIAQHSMRLRHRMSFACVTRMTSGETCPSTGAKTSTASNTDSGSEQLSNKRKRDGLGHHRSRPLYNHTLATRRLLKQCHISRKGERKGTRQAAAPIRQFDVRELSLSKISESKSNSRRQFDAICTEEGFGEIEQMYFESIAGPMSSISPSQSLFERHICVMVGIRVKRGFVLATP